MLNTRAREYTCDEEENIVTNDYIELTAYNIEPDSPVVINPEYQDKTNNDKGCYKWLPNAARTVTFKWLVGLLLLAIVGGTVGKFIKHRKIFPKHSNLC